MANEQQVTDKSFPDPSTVPNIEVVGGEIVEVEPKAPDTPEPRITRPFTDDEMKAAQLGWQPKEVFGGNPDDWRSAKDFIERGEMIGRIRSQSQKLQSIEQALKHVTSANARVYAKGYEQAISDLQVKRKEALQDGDLVRAEELQETINATKVEAQRTIDSTLAPARALEQSPTGPDPDHIMWVQSNGWYDQNTVMRRFADSAAIEFVKANAGKVSPNQVRNYVSNLVREEFPHKFVAQSNRAAPSPDGAGRSNRGNGSDQRFSKIESGMTEDETRIMKTLIRSTGMTKDEYLKMYSEAR